MGNYSMPRYFQNMPVVGKPVRANAENVAELKAIEEEIHAQIVKGLENGKADADMNAKGQLTAMQRVSLLVDPGTWCPLNHLHRQGPGPCQRQVVRHHRLRQQEARRHLGARPG